MAKKQYFGKKHIGERIVSEAIRTSKCKQINIPILSFNPLLTKTWHFCKTLPDLWFIPYPIRVGLNYAKQHSFFTIKVNLITTHWLSLINATKKHFPESNLITKQKEPRHSFTLSKPKWCAVALFFWVLAICKI